MNRDELKKKLVETFTPILKTGGFENMTSFDDSDVGFSFQKESIQTGHASLFHVYIPLRADSESTLERLPLQITVSYGPKVERGIKMRSFSPKMLSEPIDLDCRGDYFYNFNENQFYRKNREIGAEKSIDEIYLKHIRPTKTVAGLVLRLRLRFWRIWLPWVLKMISWFFHYLLLLISGDSYTYTFIFGEERLNGKIVTSRMEGRVGRPSSPEGKEKEVPAKEIDFFGNKVAQWPIVFYSLLHLSTWFVLQHKHRFTPEVKQFFDNNLLVVLYVIASFWFIDTVLPFSFKKLIKFFSSLAALAQDRRIPI